MIDATIQRTWQGSLARATALSPPKRRIETRARPGLMAGHMADTWPDPRPDSRHDSRHDSRQDSRQDSVARRAGSAGSEVAGCGATGPCGLSMACFGGFYIPSRRSRWWGAGGVGKKRDSSEHLASCISASQTAAPRRRSQSAARHRRLQCGSQSPLSLRCKDHEYHPQHAFRAQSRIALGTLYREHTLIPFAHPPPSANLFHKLSSRRSSRPPTNPANNR